VYGSWGAIASEVQTSPGVTHSEARRHSWIGPDAVDGHAPTKHPVRRSMSAQQTRPPWQSATLRQGVGMPPLDEKIEGDPLEPPDPEP
jgi:hypothetical protein